MSVQQQSVPAKDADLETTAELPVLDVAAYEAAREERSGGTDTWHMPAPNMQALHAAAASAAAANTAAVGEASAVAVAESRTARLETDLRSLSESLRDVEERLTRKGERLIVLERELVNARAERIAVDERAAMLVSEAEKRAAALVAEADARVATLHDELRTVRSELGTEQARVTRLEATLNERDTIASALKLHDEELTTTLAARERELVVARDDLRALESRTAHYLESLQTLEGRRNIFDEQLLGLEGELHARDAQISELQKQLTAQNLRAGDLGGELAARHKRIEDLEREVASLSSALQSAAAAQTESMADRAKQIENLARERDRLSAKVASLETSVGELETQVTARDAAAAEAAQTRAGLEKQLAEIQSRIGVLEGQLAAASTESAERAASIRRLEGERDAQVNRSAAAEARAVELETRLGDGTDLIRQLQDELRASLTRNSELESDLHAAEEAIHRLEAELRTKSTKLEDLTKTHEEWRSTIENARHSLAERDSLINRLESEAANSAALLGNIQQSIKRFDTSPSGSHEIAPEGAVRLLIRVDGDSEVVHVLGRKTTVGRTPDNDLQIDAKFISRNHAVILAGPNHTIIEDLNSTNGVAVNGKRVTRHTLRDGDQVCIGKTTFRFAVRPMQERRA
jgi:chromosome segregation ATPase